MVLCITLNTDFPIFSSCIGFPSQTSQEYHDFYMCVQDHQSHFNASILNAKYRSDKFKDYHPVSDANLPDSMDWRTAGAVIKLKDQVTILVVY